MNWLIKHTPTFVLTLKVRTIGARIRVYLELDDRGYDWEALPAARKTHTAQEDRTLVTLLSRVWARQDLEETESSS